MGAKLKPCAARGPLHGSARLVKLRPAGDYIREGRWIQYHR